MPDDIQLTDVSSGQRIESKHHNDQNTAIQQLRDWRDDPVAARVTGGTAAGDDLRLRSTSDASKGHIFLGEAGQSAYDEANDRLGLGTPSPGVKLDVQGTIRATGFQMNQGAQDGHVLTSDPLGNATWQPNAGGGAPGDHDHDAGDIITGTLAFARGGTGKDTIAANSILYSPSSNTLAEAALGSNLSVSSGVLNATVEVAKTGSLVGTRKRINLIEGSNVTLTVADNAGSDRVDVTIAASGSGGGVVDVGLCQGRLTLVSGNPAPASDQSSSSSVFFTPYLGNRIALYISGAWDVKTFSEYELTLSGLTSGKNYDVFAYWDGGASQVKIELGPAWSNDTTRATGLTTQDGVQVKSGDATRRWVGIIRAVSTTATRDTAANRFVYNANNRIPRPLQASATSETSTTSAAGWAAVSGTTVEFLTDGVQPLEFAGTSLLDAVNNNLAALTIGSGTTQSTNASVASHSYNAGTDSTMGTVLLRESPAAGYNTRRLLLRSSTAGNTAYARHQTTAGSTRYSPTTMLGAMLPC